MGDLREVMEWMGDADVCGESSSTKDILLGIADVCGESSSTQDILLDQAKLN